MIWGESFAGQIDDVRIDNRAHSAGRMQAGTNRPVQ
jgi:hypothetical protein